MRLPSDGEKAMAANAQSRKEQGVEPDNAKSDGKRSANNDRSAAKH